MMEMLSILQEFQKRKATKTSTRSAAFQSKKNILFAEARRNVDAVVRDGVTFIEQCKAKVIELKAQEVSEDRHFKDLALLWKNHDESVRSLLGLYPSLTEDLSHRRADQINEASVMLEAHAAERQNSRRKLVRNAKAKMDDNLENQKIATDAHALIKHYKALLLS
ncbi:hypothetical protein AcW1_006190 [Taiwanofungus camphoratus]|nr:hypothetical protein AcV5_006508 [Antrodia cinnamomea]KAI0957968.1 hypothetical protein AcW1_006190 [Antrodia cinnamomea]